MKEERFELKTMVEVEDKSAEGIDPKLLSLARIITRAAAPEGNLRTKIFFYAFNLPPGQKFDIFQLADGLKTTTNYLYNAIHGSVSFRGDPPLYSNPFPVLIREKVASSMILYHFNPKLREMVQSLLENGKNQTKEMTSIVPFTVQMENIDLNWDFYALAKEALKQDDARSKIIVYALRKQKGELWSVAEATRDLLIDRSEFYHAIYGKSHFWNRPSMLENPFQVLRKKKEKSTSLAFYRLNETIRPELEQVMESTYVQGIRRFGAP